MTCTASMIADNVSCMCASQAWLHAVIQCKIITKNWETRLVFVLCPSLLHNPPMGTLLTGKQQMAKGHTSKRAHKDASFSNGLQLVCSRSHKASSPCLGARTGRCCGRYNNSLACFWVATLGFDPSLEIGIFCQCSCSVFFPAGKLLSVTSCLSAVLQVVFH
jgi:hypothetical protein